MQIVFWRLNYQKTYLLSTGGATVGGVTGGKVGGCVGRVNGASVVAIDGIVVIVGSVGGTTGTIIPVRIRLTTVFING